MYRQSWYEQKLEEKELRKSNRELFGEKKSSYVPYAKYMTREEDSDSAEFFGVPNLF
jgi:hypothetical protein